MIRNFIFVLLSFLIVSCGSVPQDKTPAPFDNNLFTAELTGCHGTNVGLAGCHYKETEDLTQKFLEVKLFESGEYKISSTKCDYSENQIYKGSQTLKLSLDELLKNKPEDQKTCLFDVKVFVNGLDRGFRGIFMTVDSEDFNIASVNYVSGQSAFPFTGMGYLQIRAGSTKESSIVFKASDEGELVWFGCDIDGEKKFNKDPSIKLDELFVGGLIPSKSCVLEAGLIFKDKTKKPQIFSFSIQIFGKGIVQLSDPLIEYDGKRLKITAEASIAFMSIGDYYKLQHGNKPKTMSRKVTKDKTVWVRLATSNGRYNLYKILNGKVIWRSLIKY